MKLDLSFLKRDFPKKRTAVTIAALVLVAGVVAGRERPAIELVRERAPQAAAAATGNDIDLDRLRRGEARLPQNDPFARIDLDGKAPARVAQPDAPAKPAAPPLPFQYIGKWTQGEKTEVLVMRGQDLVSIDAGQKLGDYRVDQIGETQISFTYLPLKMKQTLDLPAAN